MACADVAVKITARIVEIQGGLGAPRQLVCGVCGRPFGPAVNGGLAVVDELTGYVELCPDCMACIAEVEGDAGPVS